MTDHPSNAVRKGKDEKSRRKQTKKTKKGGSTLGQSWHKRRKKERKKGGKEGRTRGARERRKELNEKEDKIKEAPKKTMACECRKTRVD